MPDKKQLKFYKYLVVVPSEQVVVPAKTLKEAEEALEYSQGEDRGAFIADARWDDDGRLMWSGTAAGYPLE